MVKLLIFCGYDLAHLLVLLGSDKMETIPSSLSLSLQLHILEPSALSRPATTLNQVPGSSRIYYSSNALDSALFRWCIPL